MSVRALISTLVLLSIITSGAFAADVNKKRKTNVKYPMSCGQEITFRPVCLELPLETQSQFQACRRMIQPYLNQVDSHYECSVKSLIDFMKHTITKVENRLSCLEVQQRTGSSIKQVLKACPRIKREYFSASELDAFINISLGFSNLFPTLYGGEECDGDEEINQSMYEFKCVYPLQGFLRKHAQKVFDETVDQLRNTALEEKEQTVSCFNDWASGIGPVYGCW